MRPGIELPENIANLPKDSRGYPIPFFVAWVKGVPQFHLADPNKAVQCYKNRLCWVCGERLDQIVAFVGGPLSCDGGSFADAACHVECAEFSAKYCPHLATPNAKRRQSDIPATAPTGFTTKHPEKIGVYITTGYRMINTPGGFIFRAESALDIRWFREGQQLPHSHEKEVCLRPNPA